MTAASDRLRRVLPDFTVIIPSTGRDSLRDCLWSIADGTVWPAHVIVVHQGSSLQVASWVNDIAARGLRAEYVPSDGRGPAAGRNRGFELVRTRFVAATDDDCRVYPDWLERLAAHLLEHPTTIVTGRVEADAAGPDAVNTASRVSVPSIITSDEPVLYDRPCLDRDPLFPQSMGFAIDIVERIGPMDEHPTVFFAEDAEWSYRALRAHVPIAYAPDVRVSHIAWRDRAQLRDTYRRYARGQGGFYGHHLHAGDRFIARRITFELMRAPWLLLRGLATGNADLEEMGRAYLGQLLPGMISGWRRTTT